MRQKYFVLLLVLVFFFLGCVGKTETSEEVKMQFYYKECNQSIDSYNPNNFGIREVKWLDTNTLEVKAYVSINCAETIVRGGYLKEGNKITLKYVSPKCTDLCALCMCAHELNYKFTNLEKGEYTFDLIREDMTS